MAKVTTLREGLWPLMMGQTVKAPFCVVCGRTYPLNQHHVIRRSQGVLYRDVGGMRMLVGKPTLTLCGSGCSGCHGDAHRMLLHFRCDDDGRWWWLRTDEPTQDFVADGMPGWRRVRDWGDGVVVVPWDERLEKK